MFQHMETEEDFLSHMPRVFVEETLFDACQLVLRGNGTQGFFAVDRKLQGIDWEELERQKGKLFSPAVIHDALGYGTLYIYPLKRSIHVFGYLIFGKKQPINLEANIVRDLELLSEIMNRFILLNMRIDELKSAEDAKVRTLDTRLATTKTLLENVIDQFPHAMFLVDRNGAVCFANINARQRFMGGNDPTGEKIEDVLPGIEKGMLEKDLFVQGELHHRQGDAYRIYNLESYPIKDNNDAISFKSIILKDVADERALGEENIYKDRMESIGKLAGGVAHDFNNVLTGILGYASLVKKMAPKEGHLGRYAEVIENSAKRAASLTEHLLNFSRRQRAKTIDMVDLNSLLGDVLFLVRESFRTIKVEKEFEEPLPPVSGDAGELQHVFLNLCVNAKDAMGEGGTLTIRTSRAAIGHSVYVAVKIEDTGPGIDDAVRAKVFEPYFTTKTEGTKLGMGLYLVQKTVKAHRGFIEMESEKGKGTTFTLYFPVADIEKTVDPDPDPLPQAGPEKRTVLVVDDEEVVRELLTNLLGSEGFKVLKAGNGAEAVEIFKGKTQSIDLVILDMIMPGMKGEEVLRRLRRVSKSIKVVVSSGFMSEDQRDKLREYGVDGFLDKPYGDGDAIRTVRSVLANSKEA